MMYVTAYGTGQPASDAGGLTPPAVSDSKGGRLSLYNNEKFRMYWETMGNNRSLKRMIRLGHTLEKLVLRPMNKSSDTSTSDNKKIITS